MIFSIANKAVLAAGLVVTMASSAVAWTVG